MGPDDFQSYLDDVLARLQGIEDAVGTPVAPVAPVTVVAPPADPAPLIVAIGLGAVAVMVAVVALLVTRQTRSALRALTPGSPADAQVAPRRAFANLMRRYSEILGVEVVTGRIPNRGDTSVDLRVQLERALATIREPGAVELLDEVGDARDHLVGLEPSVRAAENGLVAMRVEWSIERWAANPRAWLADCREQDRLQRIASRERVPVAS